MLQEKYGEIFTVHRLDQFTSGLILFAKNTAAHQLLSELFEGRTIEKKYLFKINLNELQRSHFVENNI